MLVANKKKIINDPIYGFINIHNEAIFDLISHPYFQRLRRIRQLGLTNFVYPGAEHTRFAHSLGAMYLMERALGVLRSKDIEISEEEFNAALTAILLHDIGHAPLSHVLERSFFTCKHEEISLKLMQAIGVSPLTISIFTNTYDKPFLHHLVSSQVDCDRLDYLTRDSFFTGVSEGVIGTERILNMFSVWNGELVIDEKGIYSIEKFIISRRLMYWQVYMHKTVVAADNLLLSIIDRVKVMVKNGIDINYSQLNPALLFFLKTEACEPTAESLLHFVALDDFDIFSAIKIWSYSNDKILSYLCRSLLCRNLGKVKFIDVNNNTDIFGSKTFLDSANDIVDEDMRYFKRCDLLQNSTYSFNDEQINILYKDCQVKEIFNASDYLDRAFLSKEIKKYFIYTLTKPD